MFFGVPRVWEKFHAGVRREAGREPPASRPSWPQQAMAVGRQVDRAASARGRRRPFADRGPVQAVREAGVLEGEGRRSGCREARALRQRRGAGRPRRSWSSSPAFGLPIYEVYGQSEDTGPTTFNVPGRTKFGTVGPPFPGVEVKIASDGEILVRGRNVFAGYAKDPEATAETLHDGWLHTGDLGEFDADGFLTITGRKKDIIITAGGQERRPQAARGRPAEPPAGGGGGRRSATGASSSRPSSRLDGEAVERVP